MLYGYEAWKSRKADDSRIQAAEMWFYRKLLTVKWTDRRSNECILNELATTRQLLVAMNKKEIEVHWTCIPQYKDKPHDNSPTMQP